MHKITKRKTQKACQALTQIQTRFSAHVHLFNSGLVHLNTMPKRSAWASFALFFIAVYREVFETVLFYSALSADGNGGALMGGLGLGIAVLAVLAWLKLKTSARIANREILQH